LSVVVIFFGLSGPFFPQFKTAYSFLRTQLYIGSFDPLFYEMRGSDYCNLRFDPERIGKELRQIDKAADYDFTRLALAAQYPQYAFELIMNRSNESIFDKILQEAPPNVRIIERVPFDEIEPYFARARVLLNTSVFEGFPNTFLQAGKYGVPVLSLQVDPGKLIGEKHCGIMVGGNHQLLSDGLKKLMEDNEFHQICSANIKKYVYENHGLAERVKELEEAIALDASERNRDK